MGERSNVRRTTVLPLVKAYPALSRKYGEVACVAGIDLEKGELLRLYPVPFRYLEEHQRFKKYQPISVELQIPMDDNRPESWRVNYDSIETISPQIDSDQDWDKRRPLVEPLIGGSACELQEHAVPNGKSLGIIRPRTVSDLIIEEVEIDQDRKNFAEAQASILSLFEDANERALQRTALEQIPYRFRFDFVCESSTCSGHRMSVIDWEIMQLYRRVRNSADWQARIRKKWLYEICGVSRETAFILGNHHRFRKSWSSR